MIPSDSTGDVKASALETKRKEFSTKVAAIREDLEAKTKRLAETEKTARRVDEDLSRFQKELAALKSQRDSRKGAVLEAAPQAVSVRMKELMANRTEAGDDVTAARAKLETLDAQTKVQVERRGEFDQRIEGLLSQKGDHEKRAKEFESSLQKLENEIRAPRLPATETREAVAAEAASASRRPR